MADLIARTLSSGGQAYEALQQQHLDGAQQRGATIVAVGLATTRNQAMGPIALDPSAIAQALGTQPAALDPQAGNANANATATAGAMAVTQQLPQTQAREYRSPFAALGAAVIALVIGLLVMTLVGDHASGHNDWAAGNAVRWLVAIVLAVGVGLLVWARTQPTVRVRTSYFMLPQRQQAVAPPAQPVVTTPPPTAPPAVTPPPAP